jgi:acyl carrier protein
MDTPWSMAAYDVSRNQRALGVNGDAVGSGWTTTERRVVDEIVAPLLGVVPPAADADLMGLGADSMTVIHMVAQAEELFAVELPFLELIEERFTVSGLAAAVDRHRAA